MVVFMIEGVQTNFIQRLKLSHRRRRNKAQSAIHNDDFPICFNLEVE